MKKMITMLFVAGALSLLSTANTRAQDIEITATMRQPIHEIPTPRPTKAHVWVRGEYIPRGRHYVLVPGHWAVPPHRYREWIPGHIGTKPNGREVWIRGYWR